MLVALASFTFRALTSGYTEPIGNGHRIHITEMAVFAHDRFNFAEEQSYGQWDCEKKKWSLTASDILDFVTPYTDPTSVKNIDFREFRSRHDKGSDFLVLSRPHLVENFVGLHIYISMNKKRIRIIMWIMIALAGISLHGWLYLLLTSPSRAISPEGFGTMLWGGMRFFLDLGFPVVYRGWELVAPRTYEWTMRMNVSGVYALIVFGILLLSIYGWYAMPQHETLLVMLFCGWILCGFPGQYIAVLPHVGKTHGDSSWPYSNNYVQMPDGKTIKLLSEKDRHDPRFANGYDQVLPDGRSFYVVPSK